MKRTKQKDTHTCDWCRKEKIKRKATWQHYSDFACDEHKDKILIDDGHISEADYQSWWGL